MVSVLLMNGKSKPDISAKFRGPGPRYMLPSLTGYQKHDPSRPRNPAFSLQSRRDALKSDADGPGPCRYNICNVTHRGPVQPQSFSFTGRKKEPRVLDPGPGPGSYYPENCPPMKHKRPPSFTLKSRIKEKPKCTTGPAPNAYFLSDCLGPKIPHKQTAGAFTITGRKSESLKKGGPAPNAYGIPNDTIIKKNTPAFSLKSRTVTFEQDKSGPGPAYNLRYNSGKNPPKFSFGKRHSEFKTMAITPMDNAY